ncbi:hypothetical protein KIN20_009148 [Parelaphostrongylus tenuis]|uniref:Uncharacterized protein n=1 Tax=Parelaphostrongylus tenuis TaxID=148309 RepID=A0AAD5MNQ3_PARTN|nr:hypothetical protein KIN20_009148 [Parelaphostrongylus tenuis]
MRLTGRFVEVIEHCLDLTITLWLDDVIVHEMKFHTVFYKYVCPYHLNRVTSSTSVWLLTALAMLCHLVKSLSYEHDEESKEELHYCAAVDLNQLMFVHMVDQHLGR